MLVNNREGFLDALQKWEVIDELQFIDHSAVEGNSANLILLLQKTGRVIHKFQMPELTKALDYNPNFMSGLDVAHYYFKKLGAHSLFQMTDEGDFIAVRYIVGLNPALYTKELYIMSKIAYSIRNTQKAN